MGELTGPLSFMEALKQRAAEQGFQVPDTSEPDYSQFADLIPEDTPSRGRTELDDEIDRTLAGMGIVDAYVKWCGKSTPIAGKKTESIMVSCPKPDHPDKVPSAWLNSEKDTWFCGGCQQGGDIFDIAAYHFSYPVPGYKGKDFPELRRKMAEELGLTVVRGITGKLLPMTKTDSGPDANDSYIKPPVTSPNGHEPTSPAVSLEPDIQPDTGLDEDEPTVLPSVEIEKIYETYVELPWSDIIAPNTFLAEWMNVCQKDDLPLEFYFWLGLQALAFATGNDVVLEDTIPVKTNLFVCLVGPSGMGKTRAIHLANDLLRLALPYDHDDPGNKGVRMCASPGSAEALIDMFSKPELDGDGEIIGFAPVRGLVQFDEFAEFISKSGRSGSSLKPTLMQFYDNYAEVSTTSRAHGTAIAHDPVCQVTTTTQPLVLKELVNSTDEHSGFLNRWVFAWGKPRKMRSYGATALDLVKSIDLLREVRAWSTSGHRLVLSGKPLIMWSRFFEANIEPIKATGDEPLLARLDLLLKKLILLFSINAQETRPSQASVERAIKMYEHLTWTYGRTREAIGSGPFEECRVHVLGKVKEIHAKTGRYPTISQIDHCSRRYDKLLLLKVVKTMVELGELEERLESSSSPTSKGRPAIRYEII